MRKSTWQGLRLEQDKGSQPGPYRRDLGFLMAQLAGERWPWECSVTEWFKFLKGGFILHTDMQNDSVGRCFKCKALN